MRYVDLYEENENEIRQLSTELDKAYCAIRAANIYINDVTAQMAELHRRTRLIARGATDESIKAAAVVQREGRNDAARRDSWHPPKSRA